MPTAGQQLDTELNAIRTDIVNIKSKNTAQDQMLVSLDARVKALESGGHPIPPDPNPIPPDTTDLPVLNTRSFNALDETGWDDDHYNTGNMSLAAALDAPKSAPSIVSIKYPKGFGNGGAPVDCFKTLPSKVRTIEIDIWLKFSSNFVGHDSQVNKVIFIGAPPQEGGSGPVYLGAIGQGSQTLSPEVRMQGTGGTYNLTPNIRPAASIPRGVWTRWRTRITGNNPGASDAVVDWWINEEKVGSYAGERIMSGDCVFSTLALAPNWGGLGGSVPADQFLYLDHLIIRGK